MRIRSLVTLSSFAITALTLAACTGDDSFTPLPDAAAPDGAAHDGSVGDGSAVDAGSDGSVPSADGSTGDAGNDGGTVHVQILAFNDFHGNLRPPSPTNAVVIAKPDDPIALSDAGSPTPTDAGVVDGGPLNMQVYAGGAVYFATHVKQLRAANPNTLVVSAGDMTGASPLISSLYDDEPTIDVMNTIGVDYNAVGNHELDHGPSELLRLQYGGCNLADKTDAGGSCFADPSFGGAQFEYLAANIDVSSSKTIFPPYAIRTIGGASVAFIGMTLKGTPQIVSPAGTAGLTFLDEIATVNALVPKLKASGVDAIVVLIHQGGFQAGTYDDCAALSGSVVASGQENILQIADGLDPAVDAIASAHTHVAYNCTRGGRLLTSAASYGRVITRITLDIDTGAHKVIGKAAKNVAVTRDVAPDPDVKALVDRYAALSAPIAERVVGQITGDITRAAGANGEAPLGDVAADALLAATQSQGAVMAFTNIGGLRDSLLYKPYYAEANGVVTYEKAQAVMPFKNKVEVLSCTGAQIIAALQENVYVQPGGATKLLQVSSGLAFSWDATKADANGQNAMDPSSLMVNGVAIDPTAVYVIGATDFIGNGGDGYTAFKACTLKGVVGIDLDAFTAYLGAHEPLAPPAATRVTRTH